MPSTRQSYSDVLQCIRAAELASGRTDHVRLLAVSKTRSAGEVRTRAEQGQSAFGENYVQEGAAKARALKGLGLEWHLIGHLQSNKCREAAENFDCLQSLDRLKLVAALDRWRPASLAPLDVLIQVNVDDEASKSGCRPDEIGAIADAVAAATRLRLRGLMAIPAPLPDLDRRRLAFRRMRGLYETLAQRFPGIDTLSMGMSEDFELAIAEGATMVRLGSVLFGPR